METRTVDVVLQHPDGRLVARLTARYPAPPTLAYAGQQWHRADHVGVRDPVYHADRPFARPQPQDQPTWAPAAGVPRRHR